MGYEYKELKNEKKGGGKRIKKEGKLKRKKD